MVRPVNVAEKPEQHVEHDHRPRVADMGEVVDGGAADVHAHRLRVDRREILLGAGERVVEAQRGGLAFGGVSSWVWGGGFIGDSRRRHLMEAAAQTGAARVAG